MTNPWPHDRTADKFAFYGDFREKTWASINLIKMACPYPLYYGRIKLTSILCHRKVAPSLTKVFSSILTAVHEDLDKLKAIRADQYSGCFNVRKISGSDNWSNHSWAMAIDLDAAHNSFNTGAGTMSPLMIDAFLSENWRWGGPPPKGSYIHRTDPMHFEAVQS